MQWSGQREKVLELNRVPAFPGGLWCPLQSPAEGSCSCRGGKRKTTGVISSAWAFLLDCVAEGNLFLTWHNLRATPPSLASSWRGNPPSEGVQGISNGFGGIGKDCRMVMSMRALQSGATCGLLPFVISGCSQTLQALIASSLGHYRLLRPFYRLGN